MGKIIATVGQKGGVGKSTIARLVAVEAARRGSVVRLCDLDPNQGTAVEWKGRRDVSEIDPDLAVEKCRTVSAALAYRDSHDLLVLDTPAFLDKRSLEVAKAADLIILPTGLGEDDLRPQVIAAYGLMDSGIDEKQLAFAICRARSVGESAELSRAVAYLRTTGLQTILPALAEKPSIRQAHNRGGTAAETGFKSIDNVARILADHILIEVGLG